MSAAPHESSRRHCHGSPAHWTARVLLLVFSLASIPSARAQNLAQLATNDPGTPGARTLEINLGWTTDRRPDATTQALPALELNYGVGPNVQLLCAASRLRASTGDGSTHTAFGNTTAGVKWRFFDRPDSGFSASLFPQIEFCNASSRAIDHGLAADETTLTLSTQSQWRFGPCALVAEGGFIHPSQSPDAWLAALALNREFTPRFSLALEVTASGPRDASCTTAALGAWLALGERSALLLSFGRELHRTDAPRATLISYVGWRLTL